MSALEFLEPVHLLSLLERINNNNFPCGDGENLDLFQVILCEFNAFKKILKVFLISLNADGVEQEALEF